MNSINILLPMTYKEKVEDMEDGIVCTLLLNNKSKGDLVSWTAMRICDL